MFRYLMSFKAVQNFVVGPYLQHEHFLGARYVGAFQSLPDVKFLVGSVYLWTTHQIQTSHDLRFTPFCPVHISL